MKKPTPKPTHGGKRPGSGRKPANYTSRIWVTIEEKQMIKEQRSLAGKSTDIKRYK